MKLFKMSDLGLLNFYLGIEVKQTADGSTLNQAAYATKNIEKSGLEGCNACHVPMEPRFKLSKVSIAPLTDATTYRSIVGILRYLVHTWPDIAYSVGYVSRFMEAPTTEHLAAVKHILRVLVHDKDTTAPAGRLQRQRHGGRCRYPQEYHRRYVLPWPEPH